MATLDCAAIVRAEDDVAARGERRPDPVAMPEDPEPDDAQDLLFLGEKRPVFVRVRLRVDGRSFRIGWDAFVQKMFRDFDYNADGLLAGNEIGKIPSHDLLLDGSTGGAPQGATAAKLNIDVAPEDGLITPQEFSDYLLRAGGRALALQVAAPQSQRFAQPGQVARGGSMLFELLDADRDGQLSKEELAGYHAALRRRDFDDDGSFSALELQPPQGPQYFFSSQAAGVANAPRPAQFVELSAAEPRDAIVRKLLDCYDRAPPAAEGAKAASADDRLSQSELPLSEAEFARFDANADGALDFEELSAFVSRPEPALELVARMGTRPHGAAPVEIVRRDPQLPLEVRQGGAGEVLLFLCGTQVQLGAEGVDPGMRSRDFLIQQFKAADTDNNQYLERKEVMRTVFGQLFDTMDANDDGKLFEAELVAFVERRESAARSRSVMSVADEGQNLFEALDTNGDGRLSPRELQSAAARFADWDADGDGRLATGEIPRHLRVTFGRAQPNIPGLPGFLPGPMPAPGQPPPGPGGPAWFHRMDKNRDGDVSRREFLGTREAFDRLDKNGDGLIDRREAEGAATGRE